jgi:hypothetical protein
VSTVDLFGARWRKSSRSSGDGNNDACVQVAFAGPTIVVRDSKNAAGPMLTFVPAHWHAFVTATKAGHFDHR